MDLSFALSSMRMSHGSSSQQCSIGCEDQITMGLQFSVSIICMIRFLSSLTFLSIFLLFLQMDCLQFFTIKNSPSSPLRFSCESAFFKANSFISQYYLSISKRTFRQTLQLHPSTSYVTPTTEGPSRYRFFVCIERCLKVGQDKEGLKRQNKEASLLKVQNILRIDLNDYKPVNPSMGILFPEPISSITTQPQTKMQLTLHRYPPTKIQLPKKFLYFDVYIFNYDQRVENYQNLMYSC